MIRSPELTLQVTGLNLGGRWYPRGEGGKWTARSAPAFSAAPPTLTFLPQGSFGGWAGQWCPVPVSPVLVYQRELLGSDLGIWSCPRVTEGLGAPSPSLSSPCCSDSQVEEMEVRRLWCPPRPNVCSNTDLDGWPHGGAGVLRAAGETQGLVCGPLGGWLCWGRAAQEWRPRGPGSCRRGPHLGHRGCSAGPRARGHTHSLVGSGPRPPALLQSGPRCTAGHRPLSRGRREEAGPSSW